MSTSSESTGNLRQRTPPFLAWAIDHRCDFKRLAIDQSPLSIERVLRPIRAWSDAEQGGRIVDSICLAPVQPEQASSGESSLWGFDQAEVLEPFGGADSIRTTCGSCPANGHGTLDALEVGPAKNRVVGCYGWVPIESAGTDLISIHESVIATEANCSDDVCFPITKPAWYGLWIEPRIKELAKLELLKNYVDGWLSRMPSSTAASSNASPSNIFNSRSHRPDAASLFLGDTLTELRRIRSAIERCLSHQLTIQVMLLPGGWVHGRNWKVDSHCVVCKSPMPEKDRKCSACGKVGGPHPTTKRCALGVRPFMPLDVFCSPDRIAAISEALGKRQGEN